MSVWLVPWWIIANAALGHVVFTAVRRWRKARRRRAHQATMQRILHLELALGVGLFYARDWLRERPADQWCWGCGKRMIPSSYSWGYFHERAQDDPELAKRLCHVCIAQVDRELAEL